MNNRYTKIIAAISFFTLMLFLTGCSDASSQADLTVPPSNALEPDRVIVEPDRVIDIEAFQFGYEPSIIEVTQGERIRLRLTTRDVPHGLYIPTLGISTAASGGSPGIVDFTAGAPGEYSFICSLYCGSGHNEMSGKLIIR